MMNFQMNKMKNNAMDQRKESFDLLITLTYHNMPILLNMNILENLWLTYMIKSII